MIIIDLIFEFVSEHIKYSKINLSKTAFVVLVGFFIAVFMFFWWNKV